MNARTALLACSIAALLATIALRLLGPSDLYDQTQPKTIAYTTDIIVHGGLHWVLPVERGELPATKPPLYNWLAVPGVTWLGFHSEIAHKLPSIAAMLACWLIIVRLGRCIACEELGWLAAMMFVSSYAIFKLGYLARPDMLLMLGMRRAWLGATRALSSEGRAPQRYAFCFWLAVALAALTKGPAALMVVAYALLAARFVAGRWSAIRVLHPVIGMLSVLLVCGAWVYGVWRINPAHLQNELWFNEIYGRVTGTGREGSRDGAMVWLREMPYTSFYFITRFLPWSVFSLLAALAIWRTRNQDHWLRGCVIFMVLTIAVFSLSIGKRSDYVAIAYPQAAMLAAWWLMRDSTRSGLRRIRLSPQTATTLLAALSLAFVSYYDHKQVWAPQIGFGNAIREFINDSTRTMAANPGPAFSSSAGMSHMPAMLGLADGEQRHLVPEAVARGEPFWVIAGRTLNPPREFDEWLQRSRLRATAEAIVRSADLPREDGWPGRVTLWRVTPY